MIPITLQIIYNVTARKPKRIGNLSQEDTISKCMCCKNERVIETKTLVRVNLGMIAFNDPYEVFHYNRLLERNLKYLRRVRTREHTEM